MDYVLLSPDEAATLLGLSSEQIVALIESGELGGLRVAGHWRVPLKSIPQMLAAGTTTQTMRALERVFKDKTAWNLVFGAHPEVTQSIGSGDFPQGSVGALLKEAITRAVGEQEPVIAPDSVGDTRQDAAYWSNTGKKQAAK